MREKIAALSPRTEFLVVIGLVYGNSLFRYCLSVFRNGFTPIIAWDNGVFIRLLVIEISVALCLGLFLYFRGWRWVDLNIYPSIKATGIGILIWFCAYLLCDIFYVLSVSIFSNSNLIRSISFQGHIYPPLAFIVSIINPIFEEIFHLSFIIKSLEKHGAAFAIGISTLLRLLVHLYQGPLMAVSILPIGILFAAYYWHSRQLWPILIAHGIFDFIGLLSMS